jgi:hypothetical protein
MAHYYQERLSAERLERVYEVAPPRVKRYLSAEIDASARIVEVDSSSIFCEIVPGDPARREKGLIQ